MGRMLPLLSSNFLIKMIEQFLFFLPLAQSMVTLRELSNETLTFQGRFAIISISGSLVPFDYGTKRLGGFMIMFQGPDGRVLGGRVCGRLTAYGPVRLELGSFLPGYCLNQQELEETSVKKRKLYRIHEKEGENNRPAAGITLPIKKEPIEWGVEEESGGDREQEEGFTAPINHEVEEAGGVGGDRVPRVNLPAPNIEVGGTMEQASEEMNEDLQSLVTGKHLKGVPGEASEGDNVGNICISPGSDISSSKLLNSSSFPNFQEMGDALSLIVTEGMAGNIDSYIPCSTQ